MNFDITNPIHPANPASPLNPLNPMWQSANENSGSGPAWLVYTIAVVMLVFTVWFIGLILTNEFWWPVYVALIVMLWPIMKLVNAARRLSLAASQIWHWNQV